MVDLLIAIVVILVVIAVAKLIRVFELTAHLKGTDQAEVTLNDNRTQSRIFLVAGIAWLAFVIYGAVVWGKHILPPSASVHGERIDGLMSMTWTVITPMFFITHLLLILFTFKYYFRKDRSATFFPHSNKLELIWTVLPTIVLASLIIYGLTVWGGITGPEPDDSIEVELYAKQFDWAARYAGEDNVLGRSGYRLIEGKNPLGVSMEDPASMDDKIIRGELHLPVGRPVVFKFHSRDVIHSAYMPHFRLQMNCVPGMTTQFHMVPKTTTAEMKEQLDDPDFEYILLCNKICGTAHYNMQMDIIVESEEDYNAWIAGKKTLAETLVMVKEDPVSVTEAVEDPGSEDPATEEDGEHREEESAHG